MESIKIVGASSEHVRLLEQLRKVAPTPVEVFIHGPTGVGKERYARYLHEHSGREGMFVAVNCGALPSELLENELFGHVEGAFTGARGKREGLIAGAEGGTLFLDEIDALAKSNQAKLLRFVQEREYRRLGESQLRQADVRIVSATNADLSRLIRSGSFRSDLFFRLHVVPISVPPLRERLADISVLLDSFATYYSISYGLPRIEYTKAALVRLQQYAWPGNVRELENHVRYLTAMRPGHTIKPEDLTFMQPDAASEDEHLRPRLDIEFQRAKRQLIDDFERRYIAAALQRNDGNISRAARASGKSRRAFFELMRKHGLGGNVQP